MSEPDAVTRTIDLRKTQPSLKELVLQTLAGVEIVLTEGDIPIAKMVPVSQRIAGLHSGAIRTSKDFDEPLSDEFWTTGS